MLIILKIIVIYILVAIILGFIPANLNFEQPEDGIDIFIVSNGVHTDFILPIKSELVDWTTFFSPYDFKHGMEMASHIAFGWGDKGFYLHTPEWKDLKFKTAFVALFLPSESAMHVTLWNQPVENRYTEKIKINKHTYVQIIEYIRSSFLLDQEERPIKIDHPGYGSYDLFYESVLTFHLYRTCNVWTNTGLIKSGIRTSVWTPFDKPILYQLSRIN